MKKSMKKIGVALVLVASMGLVGGCGTPKVDAPAPAADAKEKMVTVGISQFADQPSLDNCRVGFIEGLKQGGFEEGKNLTIKVNSAQTDPANANQIAQNFVSSKVDLICGIATPAAQSAYNAAESKGIPVIYTAVSDPIAAGLTMEGGKPGLAVSGTCDQLPLEKQVAMIRAMMPDAKTIGIIYSTSEANSISHIAQLEEIVPKYNFTLETIGVSAQGDIPMAVDSILTKVDCINNLTDNLVVNSLAVVLDKANAKGIPVFGSEVEQVKMGCAASESINYVDLGIQTGKMAARVLNGEDIKTMAYETVADSELVVNSKVMAGFGLTLPKDMTAKDVSAE